MTYENTSLTAHDRVGKHTVVSSGQDVYFRLR